MGARVVLVDLVNLAQLLYGVALMFETLSNKLQNAFKNLRALGKISEANVGDSLREVRLALLDATSISRWAGFYREG